MRVLLGSRLGEEIGTALASTDGADEGTDLVYPVGYFDSSGEGKPKDFFHGPWLGKEVGTALASPDSADEGIGEETCSTLPLPHFGKTCSLLYKTTISYKYASQSI